MYGNEAWIGSELDRIVRGSWGTQGQSSEQKAKDIFGVDATKIRGPVVDASSGEGMNLDFPHYHLTMRQIRLHLKRVFILRGGVSFYRVFMYFGST
jgi:hypothetical protein